MESLIDCNICRHKSHFLFKTIVLNKHNVKYYKCSHCSFIQTEYPYWLNEAYVNPISTIDVGLLNRNIDLCAQVSGIIDTMLPNGGTYLDYGGGYGTFVRLMRDKGYNFYLLEQYAENLFAKYFELKDSSLKTGFSCLTALEVFEHLQDPLTEIQKMFELSDTIIFSTELQPGLEIKSANDWWYFVPEGGQHVSFYSYDSLLQLKEIFGCNLYTNKTNLHILSKALLKDPFEKAINKQASAFNKLKYKLFGKEIKDENRKRESLMMKDFEYLKKKVSNGKI